MTKEDLAGRRLVILLFDTSSMQPEDVQRSIDSAEKYVQTQMTESDLVAVATVSTTLDVLSDFTADRVKVRNVLAGLSAASGLATTEAVASTMATDEATAAATDETAADSTEFDLFNNDVRLRALKTLAERLQDIEQKKAIVYFSAGMQKSGSDNQVELRLAVNAAVRANVSIYPVDTRGLQAVIPGGAACQGSRGGRGLGTTGRRRDGDHGEVAVSDRRGHAGRQGAQEGAARGREAEGRGAAQRRRHIADRQWRRERHARLGSCRGQRRAGDQSVGRFRNSRRDQRRWPPRPDGTGHDRPHRRQHIQRRHHNLGRRAATGRWRHDGFDFGRRCE